MFEGQIIVTVTAARRLEELEAVIDAASQSGVARDSAEGFLELFTSKGYPQTIQEVTSCFWG